MPILEFFQDPVVAAKVDDLVEAGRQLTFTNGNITVDWGILVAAGALALLGGSLTLWYLKGTISIYIIALFCLLTVLVWLPVFFHFQSKLNDQHQLRAIRRINSKQMAAVLQFVQKHLLSHDFF